MKEKFFLCFCLIILFNINNFYILYSDQLPDECLPRNRRAQKYYEEAINAFKSYNPNLAYKYLLLSVKEDSTFGRALLTLADINLDKYSNTTNGSIMTNYKNLAIEYYIKAANACPSLDNYKPCYYASILLYREKRYKEAQKYALIYIKNAPKNTKEYNEISEILKRIEVYFELKNNPVPFNPRKIECLNLDNTDIFLPFLSPDNEILFFTIRKGITNTYGVHTMMDVFYYAENVKDSINVECYTNPLPMPYPFNQSTEINQGAASITVDNSEMYVTMCQGLNCDIWKTKKEGENWGKLEPLSDIINGPRTWESQPSISADGKVLYFASIRPGNVGFNEDDPSTYTSDIWVSYRDENGNWSEPKNLGPPINTPGNEKSPFIHSDYQTLYFSSDGHPGVGGYDIFFSRLNPDGTWSEPQNIGYPINSEDDEVGLIVSLSGKKALFSTNRNNKNKFEIFCFDLPEKAKPKEVVIFKGTVKDENNMPISNAKVSVKTTDSYKTIETFVDKITGKYAVAIPIQKPDAQILVSVKKTNYAFTSALYNASDIKEKSKILTNFEVKPINEGTTVELHNIYFKTDSWELDSLSFIVLDEFLNFLNENKNIIIELHGHTDNTGDFNYNIELSKKRAESVANYLLNKGLEKKRIRAVKGFGPLKPIASNNTQEGRSKNRRTEFVIVKK